MHWSLSDSLFVRFTFTSLTPLCDRPTDFLNDVCCLGNTRAGLGEDVPPGAFLGTGASVHLRPDLRKARRVSGSQNPHAQGETSGCCATLPCVTVLLLATRFSGGNSRRRHAPTETVALARSRGGIRNRVNTNQIFHSQTYNMHVPKHRTKDPLCGMEPSDFSSACHLHPSSKGFGVWYGSFPGTHTTSLLLICSSPPPPNECIVLRVFEYCCRCLAHRCGDIKARRRERYQLCRRS